MSESRTIPSHITSEDDFLALISAAFPNTHPSVILGRGDDCAEIACPPRMAVSTDLFVEDVHFRRAYFTPEEIGYKALAVNISDIAAAGAKPLGISVGLVAPVPFARADAEGIIAGMKKAAAEHDIALTGGDLSRGGKLAFCVTIWGGPANYPADTPASVSSGGSATATADGAPFLRRGPVAPNDALFVYGRIGLARTGLTLLEERGRSAMAAYPASCAAHLTPVPQVSAGQVLAAVPGCRLMDVSDGLARDLPRLLKAHGPERGAAIALPKDALHREVIAFCEERAIDPLPFAFGGGEDYALLGCCPEEAYAKAAQALAALPGDTPLLRLGTVTDGAGIILNDTPLRDLGFDHFG